MTGHVFVVNGDLTRIACDAWLLPTDAGFDIENPWATAIGLPTGRCAKHFEAWRDGERVRLTDRGDPEGPAIWLGDIGRYGESAAWYVQGAAAFVEEAANSVNSAPRSGRVVPLLAMPLVGTGVGGIAHRKGDLLVALFTALHALVAEHHVDVAVVCWGAKPYGAAQRARLVSLGGSGDPAAMEQVVASWPFAGDADHIRHSARKLAAHARNGRLSVFAGAGVSVAAGLPKWDDLIVEMAAMLGAPIDSTMFDALPDPRDRASLLERRFLAEGKQLKNAVADRLQQAARYTMLQGLITSLPVSEFITTNFDTLLQDAATTAGRELIVLPPTGHVDADPDAITQERNDRRWMLHLHGSVADPESLVFTRAGYIDAIRHQGALFGLVQAMLVAREMLFVGYSLRDEDFHELVHEVRRALPLDVRGDRLGTTITLTHEPAHEELWAGDVAVVAMGGPSAGEIPAASREVERFIDLVGLLAADRSAFILDPEYAGMLTPDERSLVGLLEPLTDGRVRLTDMRDWWVKVAKLLSELGFEA